MRSILAFLLLVASPVTAQGLFVPPAAPTSLNGTTCTNCAMNGTTTVNGTATLNGAGIATATDPSTGRWNYIAGTNVTIANTTTETSIASAPQQGSLTIPAALTNGAFMLQIHVDGTYTAATVTPGTLTQRIKLNGVTVCSVTLGNLATTGMSNLGADGDTYIIVSSTGAVRCSGRLGYQTSGTNDSPGYWQTVGTPTITPGTAITIDYTGQWSAAVNSITATAVFGTLTR